MFVFTFEQEVCCGFAYCFFPYWTILMLFLHSWVFVTWNSTRVWLQPCLQWLLWSCVFTSHLYCGLIHWLVSVCRPTWNCSCTYTCLWTISNFCWRYTCLWYYPFNALRVPRCSYFVEDFYIPICKVHFGLMLLVWRVSVRAGTRVGVGGG